ncbi:MAG: hypothetical protein FWD76_03530 [Firmicutes bacterium]|nr:hypothetical protein [Bacillota bacterium]
MFFGVSLGLYFVLQAKQKQERVQGSVVSFGQVSDLYSQFFDVNGENNRATLANEIAQIGDKQQNDESDLGAENIQIEQVTQLLDFLYSIVTAQDIATTNEASLGGNFDAVGSEQINLAKAHRIFIGLYVTNADAIRFCSLTSVAISNIMKSPKAMAIMCAALTAFGAWINVIPFAGQVAFVALAALSVAIVTTIVIAANTGKNVQIGFEVTCSGGFMGIGGEWKAKVYWGLV